MVPLCGGIAPGELGPAMQMYELLYIVPTTFTDPEVEGIMANVGKILTSVGITPVRHENVGKIKLAYPIKRVRHGSYILAYFEAEAAALVEFERQLGLTNEVLRHMTLAVEPGTETRPFQMISYVAPLSEEGREESRDTSDRPRARTSKRDEVEAPAGQVIADLDKKLDEILDTDIADNV